MNQLEELMANTLTAVDKLTADMDEFRNYAYENTKVVNSLLRKMDDRDEEFKKWREKQDMRWNEQSKKWEKQDKINDQMIQTLVDIRKSLR